MLNRRQIGPTLWTMSRSCPYVQSKPRCIDNALSSLLPSQHYGSGALQRTEDFSRSLSKHECLMSSRLIFPGINGSGHKQRT